jgi:alpha-D-ribose 1-methylphosphonate 5-triphosphate synthase subunit PhnH
MQTDDIIHDHTTFRVLMRAMSSPGRVCQLPHHREVFEQRGLLAVVLRCLMDHEVTYFVSDDKSDGLSHEIFRYTGSNRADIDTADFLIFLEGTSRGALTGAKRGTPEYPDGGATVVYLVEKLGEMGGEVEMHGPGINGTVRPLISGLAKSEFGLLREANAEFPLGLDVLFLDTDGRIMCIPRSTRIGVN